MAGVYGLIAGKLNELDTDTSNPEYPKDYAYVQTSKKTIVKVELQRGVLVELTPMIGQDILLQGYFKHGVSARTGNAWQFIVGASVPTDWEITRLVAA